MKTDLTRKLDLSFISRAGDLQEIAFSLHQVTLHFERMKIDIFSHCEIVEPGGPIRSWDPEGISDMTLFAMILDSRISSYEIPSDGKLVLRFSNNRELLLSDQQRGIESFVLWTDRGTFVSI